MLTHHYPLYSTSRLKFMDHTLYVSIVAADALVLQHQGISSHNADSVSTISNQSFKVYGLYPISAHIPGSLYNMTIILRCALAASYPVVSRPFLALSSPGLRRSAPNQGPHTSGNALRLIEIWCRCSRQASGTDHRGMPAATQGPRQYRPWK